MITLTEAARMLGIDPGTLRVQIHNGKLKARKVGPIWVVTPKEVERYRQQSRSGSHAVPCKLVWCKRPTCRRQ